MGNVVKNVDYTNASPCPYCGSSPPSTDALLVYMMGDTDTDFYYVKCCDCGATGPVWYNHTVSEAIDSWNMNCEMKNNLKKMKVRDCPENKVGLPRRMLVDMPEEDVTLRDLRRWIKIGYMGVEAAFIHARKLGLIDEEGFDTSVKKRKSSEDILVDLKRAIEENDEEVLESLEDEMTDERIEEICDDVVGAIAQRNRLRVAVQDLLSELRIDEVCLEVMANGYSPDYPGGRKLTKENLAWENPHCKIQISKVVAQKLINAGV